MKTVKNQTNMLVYTLLLIIKRHKSSKNIQIKPETKKRSRISVINSSMKAKKDVVK